MPAGASETVPDRNQFNSNCKCIQSVHRKINKREKNWCTLDCRQWESSANKG